MKIKFFNGLQPGIQLHFNETHFADIKRTFVTILVQTTFSYILFPVKNNAMGVSVAAGAVFYKINDYIYKIKNGFIFNGELFYEISKRHKIRFGLEKQVDNASFYYENNPPSPATKFNFSLNRLSMFVGCGFKIR
ncbi:MAG: hypothetical protein KF825_04415 [Ferruginibacter sp.]|nr:hypothetical protein [Ferruginibacter sp.]